jgi:hypothetical protein
MFALPSWFTPVGMPASGNLEIMAEVSETADKPGLSSISHNNNIGGIGITGGLNALNALFIVVAILSIHPILTLLIFCLI